MRELYVRWAAIVLAALVTGCAHTDPWTERDTAMYSTVLATLVADGVTTSRIQDDPTLEEGGPVARYILGEQPSTTDTALYMGGLAIGYYFIGRAMPAEWRPWFYGFVILDHGSAVIRNCNHGLC